MKKWLPFYILNKLGFLGQHKLVRNLRRILDFVKCALKKQKSGQKKDGKKAYLVPQPQTVCYVGNPESDDNCRQSLTFDKKKSHIKYVNYCIMGTFWAVRFWVRFQH